MTPGGAATMASLLSPSWSGGYCQRKSPSAGGGEPKGLPPVAGPPRRPDQIGALASPGAPTQTKPSACVPTYTRPPATAGDEMHRGAEPTLYSQAGSSVSRSRP